MRNRPSKRSCPEAGTDDCRAKEPSAPKKPPREPLKPKALMLTTLVFMLTMLNKYFKPGGHLPNNDLNPQKGSKPNHPETWADSDNFGVRTMRKLKQEIKKAFQAKEDRVRKPEVSPGFKHGDRMLWGASWRQPQAESIAT